MGRAVRATDHYWARPRRRRLAGFESGEAVLSYYPAGHVMAEHSHDFDQRSIILAGALAEDTPGAAAAPTALYAGFKAAGLRHENRYGPDGALIIAVNTTPTMPSGPVWRWRGGADAGQVRALMKALCAGAADADSVVADLVAISEAPAETSPPSSWLRRVRDAIETAPQSARVQTLADEAGVHRVYLARAYKAAYGAPISLDRRRFKTAHALWALLEGGASPAEAAALAGFADQPHFTRCLQADTGLTPARLMAMLQATAC